MANGINPNTLAIGLAGLSKLFTQPGQQGQNTSAVADLALGLAQQQQQGNLLAQLLGGGQAAAQAGQQGLGAALPELGTEVGAGTPEAGTGGFNLSALQGAGAGAGTGAGVNMDAIRGSLLARALGGGASSPFNFRLGS